MLCAARGGLFPADVEFTLPQFGIRHRAGEPVKYKKMLLLETRGKRRGAFLFIFRGKLSRVTTAAEKMSSPNRRRLPLGPSPLLGRLSVRIWPPTMELPPTQDGVGSRSVAEEVRAASTEGIRSMLRGGSPLNGDFRVGATLRSLASSERRWQLAGRPTFLCRMWAPV